jgi:hypothetical protein
MEMVLYLELSDQLQAVLLLISLSHLCALAYWYGLAFTGAAFGTRGYVVCDHPEWRKLVRFLKDFSEFFWQVLHSRMYRGSL